MSIAVISPRPRRCSQRVAPLGDADRHSPLLVLLDVCGEPARRRLARRALSGAAGHCGGFRALVRRDDPHRTRELVRSAARPSAPARTRGECRLSVQLEDAGRECPVDRRGRSNALIAIGLALGPAFGTYVGGKILAQYGWRALFISLGALSLFWLIPWIAGPVRELPSRRREGSGDGGAQPFSTSLESARHRRGVGALLRELCLLLRVELAAVLSGQCSWLLDRANGSRGWTHVRDERDQLVDGRARRRSHDRARRVAASRLRHHNGDESYRQSPFASWECSSVVPASSK